MKLRFYELNRSSAGGWDIQYYIDGDFTKYKERACFASGYHIGLMIYKNNKNLLIFLTILYPCYFFNYCMFPRRVTLSG